jgi:hypothetical protein
MNPHPSLSLALITELNSERTRVRRFRPSGGRAVRRFRPAGHGPRVAGPASSAGCLNA